MLTLALWSVSFRIAPSLARSASLPTNHPHARKPSLSDGQFQIQAVPSVPPLSTTSLSTPSFSLALDPITEGLASPNSPATSDMLTPGGTFPHLQSYPSGTNTIPNGLLDDPSRPNAQWRKPLQLGRLANARNQQTDSTQSGNFALPNTELILYSYAQLLGTVKLVPQTNTHSTMEQSTTFAALRRELQGTRAVGGGSMNIVTKSPHALNHSGRISSRPPHARSVSLSSGLLSLLSTTSVAPSSPAPPQSRGSSRHNRAPSVFSGLFSSSTEASDLDSADVLPSVAEEEAGMSDSPLPTFDVPPTMLGVDLCLQPGRSRTCEFCPIPVNVLIGCTLLS